MDPCKSLDPHSNKAMEEDHDEVAVLNDVELDFGEVCRESVRRLSIDSNIISQGKTIFDDHSNRIIPQDIETGHVLGSGTFGTVRELKALKRCSTTSSMSTKANDSFANESLASSSIHSGTSNRIVVPNEDELDGVVGASLYAVKQLRQDLSSSKRKCGSIDLVVEAQLLTSLAHRNIVTLEGIGDNPGSKGFFIIIERLDRTLTQELKAWRNKEDLIKNGRIQSSNPSTGLKDLLYKQLDSRLEYAYDLSSALSYLHEKNILFRDIKPDNIGFTKTDQIKIFDFGLAKELRRERYIAPNKYHGSIAGSFRYMSPEMMRGAPHGLPSDVYSFAILLWEMIHLKQPYARKKPQQHKKDVLVWRTRPRIKHSVPCTLKSLLKESWKHNPQLRPIMKDMHRSIGLYLLSRKKITCLRS